jgi:hypothetical protein
LEFLVDLAKAAEFDEGTPKPIRLEVDCIFGVASGLSSSNQFTSLIIDEDSRRSTGSMEIKRIKSKSTYATKIEGLFKRLPNQACSAHLTTKPGLTDDNHWNKRNRIVNREARTSNEHERG